MASATWFGDRLRGALAYAPAALCDFGRAAAPSVAAPPPPPPSPKQKERDLVCREVLHAVHRASLRSPADVTQWLVAQQACQEAKQAQAAEARTKAQSDARQMAKQAAPVVAVVTIARALFVPGLTSLGVMAGTLWASMRYNLAPLLGRYPKSTVAEVFDEAALEQKDDALWAREMLRATLQATRERLGPLPQSPRVQLPSPGTLAEVRDARRAVVDLAHMLDAYRQRHHYVAATVQSLGAEAAHAARGARNTLLAAEAGAGARAVKFCAAALALSFAVGLLHPFASVLGFFLSCVCLVGAGFLLVTNVRRAVRYLDGTLTDPAGGPRDLARKHETLAAVAELQGRLVDQAWPVQHEAERELACLLARLDALPG